MMPPFKTPSNASYFFSGFHCATTSPFFGKLRICSPSGFAGPQPQQALFGAYFSWSDLSFMLDKYTGTEIDNRIAIKSETEDGATRALTYKTLRVQTNEMAAALRSLGLGKGDAIGVFMVRSSRCRAATSLTARSSSGKSLSFTFL